MPKCFRVLAYSTFGMLATGKVLIAGLVERARELPVEPRDFGRLTNQHSIDNIVEMESWPWVSLGILHHYKKIKPESEI